MSVAIIAEENSSHEHRLIDDAESVRVELLTLTIGERDPHAVLSDPPDFADRPISLARHTDELNPLACELRLQIL